MRKPKRRAYLDASIAFGQWQSWQRIDRVQEQAMATEATSWRKSLLRILNIVMNLAMMSLALSGHCEHTVGDGECHGGNFLELVAMQPRFDPVLQDLTFTKTPARTAKYLSANIENENKRLSQLLNVVTEIIQHAIIIHTIRNTRNIRNIAL